FDYQITFGRFSKRIDTTYNTSIFTPPGRQEPQLYLHLDTQHNSVRVLLCVESSKKAVNCKTTRWFVTMDETKWQEKGKFLQRYSKFSSILAHISAWTA